MRDLHVFGIKCTYVRRWRRASQRNNASQHAERQDSRSRANALEKGTVRVGHSTTHRADESGHSCRPGPAVGHSCKPWLSPARAARTTIERQLLTVQRQPAETPRIHVKPLHNTQSPTVRGSLLEWEETKVSDSVLVDGEHVPTTKGEPQLVSPAERCCVMSYDSLHLHQIRSRASQFAQSKHTLPHQVAA